MFLLPMTFHGINNTALTYLSKDTELPQTSVPTSVADEAVNEEMDDSLERAATTATSLDAEQDRGNISKTQSKETPNELGSQRTSSGGGPRVLNLETTKTTQALEIDSLKRRVKKLEKSKRSRTHRLKRLYKVGLSARVESSKNEGLSEDDASKQGRITDIDANEDITLVKVDAAQIKVTTTAKTLKISIDEVTLAQALVELKHTKPNAMAKWIVFHEPKESTTTTTAIPKPESEDKGKAKMIEEPVKPKKKD
nr:hypothetical protein [Tanacetum cinerariifolium]